MLVAAEVKAPWVILHGADEEPGCSAPIDSKESSSASERQSEHRIYGPHRGRTALCAIVSTPSARQLVDACDQAWAVFNGYAVVLHIE